MPVKLFLKSANIIGSTGVLSMGGSTTLLVGSMGGSTTSLVGSMGGSTTSLVGARLVGFTGLLLVGVSVRGGVSHLYHPIRHRLLIYLKLIVVLLKN